MVEKVITSLSFIGGRLRQPGEVIDLDDQDQNIVIPASSTPLANMTDEEIEAYLRHKRGLNKTPADSRNVADPTDENTGTTAVPIADITVRSPDSTRPQGAPPGSVEINGAIVAPAGEGASSPVEQFVGSQQPGGPLDLDASGEPGGSLTKAEIVQALKDRGDEVDSSASKAELQKQLSAPPKA